MTKNLAQRNAQHESGPHQMSIQELYSGLSKKEARGVEQLLIEGRGLQKNSGSLLIQINSISKSKDPDKYERLTALGTKIIESLNVPPQQD
jgi:hypothetical protein